MKKLYKTRLCAKASIKQVNVDDVDWSNIPDKSNSSEYEIDQDLMKIVSVLLSTGINKNDDVFLAEEVVPARATGAHKPVNVEHDRTKIVGHMTKTYLTTKDGKEILDTDDLPFEFDVTNEAVLYKYLLPEIAEDVLSYADAGELFVSVEAWFTDYDYLVGDKIIKRNEKTSSVLDDTLKANGGEGIYRGNKVSRVLRNILIGGVGLTGKPANPGSIIKSISKDILNETNIEDKEILSCVLCNIGEDPMPGLKSESAKWTTKFINDLPDSSFAVVEKGGEKDDDGKTVPRNYRHLPYKDDSGKVDLPHLRNALARMNQIKALSPEDSTDRIREVARRVLIKVAKKELPNSEFVKENSINKDIQTEAQNVVSFIRDQYKEKLSKIEDYKAKMETRIVELDEEVALLKVENSKLQKQVDAIEEERMKKERKILLSEVFANLDEENTERQLNLVNEMSDEEFSEYLKFVKNIQYLSENNEKPEGGEVDREKQDDNVEEVVEKEEVEKTEDAENTEDNVQPEVKVEEPPKVEADPDPVVEVKVETEVEVKSPENPEDVEEKETPEAEVVDKQEDKTMDQDNEPRLDEPKEDNDLVQDEQDEKEDAEVEEEDVDIDSVEVVDLDIIPETEDNKESIQDSFQAIVDKLKQKWQKPTI